jgi:hypothetical protein
MKDMAGAKLGETLGWAAIQKGSQTCQFMQGRPEPGWPEAREAPHGPIDIPHCQGC